MSDFFSLLGKIQYQNYDINIPKVDLATNISARILLKKSLLSDLLTYDYTIQDGERPDTVAYYYYGDPSLSWLIFMANDMIDPYYDWPLSTLQLNDYIKSKYGTMYYATNNIHHYEKIIVEAIPQGQGNSYRPPLTTEVDYEIYRFLKDSERRAVTYYDYEVDLNNQKKEILLVEDVYVPQILNQVKTLFG